MRKIDKLFTTLRGITSTINRYPITILLFLFSAILRTYNISGNNIDNYGEILLAFTVGAAIFMVLQMVFEHFYYENKTRLLFGGLAILGAILYFLMVELVVKDFEIVHGTRTIVFLFILFICFVWVPSIKSKIGFSNSFMVVFKAFFIVAFYSASLYFGLSLIVMAIDMLIVSVGGHVYNHLASIIVFIYAPIHFLSLIPIYPAYTGKMKLENSARQDMEVDIGNDEEGLSEDSLRHRLNKATEASKFLEGLVSYIIIPITAIFTVILLLYIIMNITGDFWKDNLMEPLLVTYSITVIVVYLLASAIHSKATLYFRRIFPKLLIPVVLFQTISSILKIGQLGITSGRYYVIIFGIFATISAIIFSIRPNHKNNVIAPILIILSLISILPPVDAFTISKANQINRLTNVLEKNDMLKDDEIIANANLVEKDREIIINAVRYLSGMDFSKDISWLQSYNKSYDFEGTFGFPMYVSPVSDTKSYNYYLTENAPISISDYDVLVEVAIDKYGYSFETTPWGDEGYTLVQDKKDTIGDLVVKDSEDNELLRYSLSEISDRFKDMGEGHSELSMEEAEFVTENENAILYMVVKSFNLDIWDGDNQYQNMVAYIMVKIK